MDFKTKLSTPGWHRTLFIRRITACALLLIACALFINSQLSSDPRVVIMVRDVSAGATISAADIALRETPPELVPDTALFDETLAVGKIAASALSAGELATSTRFIGNDLLNSFVTNITQDSSVESLHMVPLKLADPSIIPLLHHGDTISVIAHSEEGDAHTIATGGRVILAGDTDPTTVLIALPSSQAEQVAATSLTSPLAVVLTGDRATTIHPDG